MPPHDPLANLPDELRALHQWVCAKASKRPINPHTGRAASVTKPATWGTFDEATAAAKRYSLPHVGFVLTATDPFCIVDLDDKPDNPASDEDREAFKQIIATLDSYTERSQSGTGYHIIVKGHIDRAIKTPHVEIYDRARYMICTGNVTNRRPPAERQQQLNDLCAKYRPHRAATAVATAATPKREDTEVLAKCAEQYGERFESLRAREWKSDYPSESEARFALLGMFAQHSADDAQVLRLLSDAALGQSAKAKRLAPQELAKIRANMQEREDSAVSLFSDLANAQRIAYHMRSELMFAPGIGWLTWTGARWTPDALHARRVAQRLGRVVMDEVPGLLQRAQKARNDNEAERLRELAEKLVKHAGQVENVQKLEAAMKAAEPLLRVDPAKLDADALLLGCENGVLDLRTGELLPPSPERLITRCTGIAYDQQAKAVGWLGFLARIFKSHPELVAFMQRLAGFWLTGRTDPALLAVLYGVGANGKSTFVGALGHVLGEYAITAPPGLLMLRRGGQSHPTELASLQGRRLAVATESGEGGRLDEEKIKALTGSDAITARRMYGDFFQFPPTHKLALQTNHRPTVRGTDEGIWRRLLLVPFDEVIPADERDPTLADKLRDEAAGILRWAVDGSVAFLRDGLQPPPIVTDATRDYRSESDILAAFIDEECVLQANATTTSRELYTSYKTWAEDNGEFVLSQNKLLMRLQERSGITPHKGAKGARYWKGLRLQNHQPPSRKF